MKASAEALVTAHLDLVQRIAKTVAKRMPAWVQMDELVALGNFGLVEAAHRYRRELHPSFACYAYKRIRGSMLDAYRGPRYPRRTEALAEDFDRIDPALDPEQALIEKEEESDLRIDAWFAERRLPLLERRLMRRHIGGASMVEIGAKEGRSPAWAHGAIHRAKRKLRDNLREYEPRKAA